MSDLAPVILYTGQRTIHMDDMDADWGVSFVKSGRHFVKALQESADPVITGQQGRDLLAFSLAAQQSARSGERVAVEPGPPPPATT